MMHVGKAREKIPKLTRIAKDALTAIQEAKQYGHELSLDEALDRACSGADTTPAELKGAVRSIVLAQHRTLTPTEDVACFVWMAMILEEEGVETAVLKPWLALSAEMGNAQAKTTLERQRKISALGGG